MALYFDVTLIFFHVGLEPKKPFFMRRDPKPKQPNSSTLPPKVNFAPPIFAIFYNLFCLINY